MDVDEDDDFYAQEGDVPKFTGAAERADMKPEVTAEQDNEDLEEGEEEDEAGSDGSDSEIDIITERKDGAVAPPPAQAKYNDIRNLSQRTGASDVIAKSAVAKKDIKKSTPPMSGADLPGVATSKIDVNGDPTYTLTGKPITQVNIDQDLSESDKPWRRPGTDISDYFNYGFDEFTWATYANKQETLRGEFSPEKLAEDSKKMMEQMNMMMSMGIMPGISGAAGGAMPGMDGMGPEQMQQMMQMMASGMDPSQMDPSAMFGNQTGAGTTGGVQAGNQGQGFVGQGGYGQGQGGQYGYDQGMMNSEGRNRGGGNFGRGRGRRGGW